MNISRTELPGSSVASPRLVREQDGTVVWFNGDVYSVKLSTEETGGSFGLVEAVVPPGGGPPPHVHPYADEAFHLVSGELEFLLGERTDTARSGDTIFVPRGNVHRFINVGIRPARMIFMYTPGGPERLFIEGGDEPQPGVPVPSWGPERLDEALMALMNQHGTTAPPGQ